MPVTLLKTNPVHEREVHPKLFLAIGLMLFLTALGFCLIFTQRQFFSQSSQSAPTSIQQAKSTSAVIQSGDSFR